MANQERTSKYFRYFQITQKTFAVVGLNPMAETFKDIVKNPLICYGNFLLTLIFLLAVIDFGVKNIDDLNELTLTISFLNQSILSIWKTTIFLIKRRRINKLMRRICSWNDRVDLEEGQIITGIYTKTTRVSKFYCRAVGASAACALLRPIILNIITIIQGSDRELELPHKASIFWNTRTLLGHVAVYIWNLSSITFVCNATLATDTLFLWLTANLLIRFHILNKRFKKAGERENVSYKEIVEHIKLHMDILNIAQEMDSIFGEIIFLKSLISCTQICFLGVALTAKDSNMGSLVYPLVFLTAVSIQLILYSYSGQQIKDQSLLVTENVFAAFNWSQLALKEQKLLLMIMMRSTRGSNVTGIFFNLDLQLFLWFFKTAASLVTVLKALEDDDI